MNVHLKQIHGVDPKEFLDNSDEEGQPIEEVSENSPQHQKDSEEEKEEDQESSEEWNR